jgi:hypothetical protein
MNLRFTPQYNLMAWCLLTYNIKAKKEKEIYETSTPRTKIIIKILLS